MNIKLVNKNSKNIIIFFLIFLIIYFLILFYIFDKKKVYVQKYLNNIYSNSILLRKKFKYLINSNCEIKKENNLFIISNFLNPDFHNFLKNQVYNENYKSINTVLRKGSGFNFFKLHNNKYEGFLETYYSIELLDILSNIIKKPIQRTPLSDENSCSLLIYSKKGDYIDWHKDYSLYYGDRYVSLLSIINENSNKDGLSNNVFCYMYNEKEYRIKIKPNTLVIFKGSEIYHKSTSINDNELRILLSMTFCDICQEKKNIINYVYEEIKNMAIYN